MGRAGQAWPDAQRTAGNGDEGVGDAYRAQRDTTDDFFCLRYSVWYSSLDCAYRTRHQTFLGCMRCEQGRFNLKRHRTTLTIAESPRRSGV